MTINIEGSSAPVGGPSPCSKCGQNPRTSRGSWCKPCRNAYAAEYRDKNRPRERMEENTPCAREGCEGTFTWRSTHKGQRYCSKACYDRVRNATKKREKRYISPAAKVTRRAADFRRRGYGITPEEFDALVERLNGRCQICDKDDRPLVPDHCHATSTFRGAICDACNHLLGKAYDDPRVLQAAATYLIARS